MRFLITSDLHLSNSKSKFKISNNGVSDLLRRQSAFMDHIVSKHLKTGDCEGFLFLGDYTDTEILDPPTLYYAAKIFNEVNEAAKESIWLEGNHCIDDRGLRFTVMMSLANKAGEHNNVVYGGFVRKQIKDVVFHCWSFIDDYEFVQNHIYQLNKDILKEPDLKHILLFHFPTSNAMLDNGMPSSRGLLLDKETCGNFDWVLGGDYHTPQQLKGTDNAFYIGAPFAFNFGECEERGYAILDTDKKRLERYQNPFAWSMKITDPHKGLPEPDLNTIVRVDSCDPESYEEFKKQEDDFYLMTLKRKKQKLSTEEKTRIRKSARVNDDMLDLIKLIDVESREGVKRLMLEMLKEV